MKIIGRLLCKVRGHKRGKRVSGTTGSKHIFFACPRCGAQWSRKARA